MKITLPLLYGTLHILGVESTDSNALVNIFSSCFDGNSPMETESISDISVTFYDKDDTKLIADSTDYKSECTSTSPSTLTSVQVESHKVSYFIVETKGKNAFLSDSISFLETCEEDDKKYRYIWSHGDNEGYCLSEDQSVKFPTYAEYCFKCLLFSLDGYVWIPKQCPSGSLNVDHGAVGYNSGFYFGVNDVEESLVHGMEYYFGDEESRELPGKYDDYYDYYDDYYAYYFDDHFYGYYLDDYYDYYDYYYTYYYYDDYSYYYYPKPLPVKPNPTVAPKPKPVHPKPPKPYKRPLPPPFYKGPPHKPPKKGYHHGYGPPKYYFP